MLPQRHVDVLKLFAPYETQYELKKRESADLGDPTFATTAPDIELSDTRHMLGQMRISESVPCSCSNSLLQTLLVYLFLMISIS